MTIRRDGHGWWPYLGPYLAFLLGAQLAGEFPDAWQPAMLVVKPALPGGLILYFFLRGGYPELRAMRFRPGWALLDIAFGVLLAVQWMGPYLLIDALPRPDAEHVFATWQVVRLVCHLKLRGFPVQVAIQLEGRERAAKVAHDDLVESPLHDGVGGDAEVSDHLGEDDASEFDSLGLERHVLFKWGKRYARDRRFSSSVSSVQGWEVDLVGLNLKLPAGTLDYALADYHQFAGF